VTCQPCCLPQRLELIQTLGPGTINAIEWIEALDGAAPAGTPRQQTLLLRLLLAPAVALTAANVRITGGTRIAHVPVEWAGMADAPPAEAEPSLVALLALLPDANRVLVLRTANSGDFSRYTLHLVAGLASAAPPLGFDPILASITFSFKVECPSELDCADAAACPPPVAPPAPAIDYLAKDYPSIRRLMLDRISLLAPGWAERSAADVGVTLVELLAYAADQLSYRQDVIATEAYLHTARQRVSVRRHTRLVDYRLHEGNNARVFVQFDVMSAGVPLPERTRLLTTTPGLATEVAAGRAEDEARRVGALVFQTVRDETLHAALNELRIHTWGDRGCRLPRGATHCTVRGHVPGLQVGHFVLLAERLGPVTLAAADADRSKRHVVRITRIERTSDPHGGLFEPVPVDAALDVTELHWDAADALPFALCVSVAERPELAISVVRGNVVLAEEGHSPSGAGEDLGAVPASRGRYAPAADAASCCEQRPEPVGWPLRWRPTLAHPSLSHGFALAELLAEDADGPRFWSANALAQLKPRSALPQIELQATPPAGGSAEPWLVQRDLLSSLAADAHFVVELDDRRVARVRFGDDSTGQRPDPGTRFVAHYRVSRGSAGNVGAMSITHVVTTASGSFSTVSNPLAAFGGNDPEDLDTARRDAPQAFRTQQRAVTAADYEAMAQRRHEVQRASARFRWTGSWHTAFVAADRRGGAAVDVGFERRLRGHLEPYRMAGTDLEVDGPRPVPLDVQLFICVEPGALRAEVQRAVAEVLSSRVRPDGTPGFFHPDRFSFGEPVYASPLVSAVQALPGVASVRLERFQRLVRPSATSLAEGVIRIGRLEIAQLAADASSRERGRLVLRYGGGL
jgi:hypothetical protein